MNTMLRNRPKPVVKSLDTSSSCQRSGNAEAVNDHRLLHRATISFIRRCNVCASRGTSWRSHHDLLLLGDGFCAQEFVVEVRTFGVTPSVELLRKVEPKDVHLPSKNTPIRQKMGVSRGRPQPGRHCRYTQSVCHLISHIFLAPISNASKRSRPQAS
jgi:hypothetical protein